MCFGPTLADGGRCDELKQAKKGLVETCLSFVSAGNLRKWYSLSGAGKTMVSGRLQFVLVREITLFGVTS